MGIQVVSELCSCCGICVEACQVGAIRMGGLQAEIDEELCTQCEACVDACPNGAITSKFTPLYNPQTMALATTRSARMPVPTIRGRLESVGSNRSLAPVAGAALAFLGSEVAPRLIDLLINALERKFAQTATVKRDPLFTPSTNLDRRSKGTRRQIRYRGGYVHIRNQKERR